MTVVGLHGEGSNMEIFDNLARNVKVKFRRVSAADAVGDGMV